MNKRIRKKKDKQYLREFEEMMGYEVCEWCDGSGLDNDGIALGNPYPCTECKGTGRK